MIMRLVWLSAATGNINEWTYKWVKKGRWFESTTYLSFALISIINKCTFKRTFSYSIVVWYACGEREREREGGKYVGNNSVQTMNACESKAYHLEYFLNSCVILFGACFG